MNKHEVTSGASSLLLGAARAAGQKCAREREMTTWRALHMRINGNRRKKTDRSLTILCPKQKNTEYTLVKISKVYIPSIYIIYDVKNNNIISKMIPY